MAKAQKQEKTMEAALWEAANKLRGAVEPAEYKHVVLSLIFLKYASDKFEERRQEIIDEGHEAFVDNIAFYTMQSVWNSQNKAILLGRLILRFIPLKRTMSL